MSVTAPARLRERRERRRFSTAIVGLGAVLGALLPLEDARGVDPEVPTVTAVSTSPDPLPAVGGTVRVSAVLQSPAGIASAGVSVYLGGDPGGQTGAAMTRSEPGSDTWVADVTIPANNGQDAVSHQLEFGVTGHDGGTALELVGSIEQLGQGEPFDQFPYVDDVTVTPQFLLSAGGDVTISAHVTDDRALSEVYATAYAPDGSAQTVEMNGVGGDDYAGGFTVPANAEPHPVAWSFDVHGFDDIGQETVTAGNQVYLDAEVPETEVPEITDITVSPDHLGAAGGVVTVTADITSSAGISDASLAVYLHDAGTEYATLARVSGGSDTFSAEVTIPGNGSTDSVEHQVEVFANGLDGGSGSASGPGIEQDGQGQFDQAPDVTVTSLDPTSLPAAGGTVTVQAVASDDRAVSEVYAEVTGPDGLVVTVPMPGAGGSRYQGNVAVPANPRYDQARYQVRVTALDDIGQPGVAAAGSITQAARTDRAPAVSRPSVTPSHLTGPGRAAVSARVTDDRRVRAVFAVLSPAVGPSTRVAMSGPSRTYRAELDVPANPGPAAVSYAVEVVAVDGAGQTTRAAAGTVVVHPTPQPGTVRLSAERLRFGRVALGSRSVERLTVTHVGGSLPLALDLRLGGRFRLLGRAAGLFGLTLAPGESVRLRVAFVPGRRSRATGRLTCSRRDGLQPDLGVSLVGRGVRPAQR